MSSRREVVDKLVQALNLGINSKKILSRFFRLTSDEKGGDLISTQCVRLGGFINAKPDYAALPAVMNGASDLMVEALGDVGRHARTTIGVAELPMDAAVEVEAIFEVA